MHELTVGLTETEVGLRRTCRQVNLRILFFRVLYHGVLPCNVEVVTRAIPSIHPLPIP
jgi:hypothetical protein